MLRLRFTEEYIQEVEEYKKKSLKFKKIVDGPRFSNNIYALRTRGKAMIGTKNFGHIVGTDLYKWNVSCGKDNLRTVFVFYEVQSTLLLVGAFEEKSKDYYDRIIEKYQKRVLEWTERRD